MGCERCNGDEYGGHDRGCAVALHDKLDEIVGILREIHDRESGYYDNGGSSD